MDYTKDSSGGLKLCDYVTLNLEKSEDTTPNDGVYSWIIPTGSYYSDRRSQVCTVEISRGVFVSGDPGTGGDEAFTVAYENGGFNHYSTGNSRPIIGLWSDTDQRVEGTGALLCDARPQHIKLKILKTSGTISDGFLSGSVTLKFKYYNSIQSSAQLHSEYTPIISL